MHQDKYILDEIVSIEYVGEEEVFDIEVEEDHSYIAEGFIVHNSNNPNQLNFPNDNRIKDAFVAPKGYKFMSADFAAQEIRETANVTCDPELAKLFQIKCGECGHHQEESIRLLIAYDIRDKIAPKERCPDVTPQPEVCCPKCGVFKWTEPDPHSLTAKRVFPECAPLSLTEIRKQFGKTRRQQAKVLQFLMLYGGNEYTLADRLFKSTEREDVKKAKEIIDSYFESNPYLRAAIDKVIADARRLGYVETLGGYRRHLPDLNLVAGKPLPRPKLDEEAKQWKCYSRVDLDWDDTQPASERASNMACPRNKSCKFLDECKAEFTKKNVEKLRKRAERQAFNIKIQGSCISGDSVIETSKGLAMLEDLATLRSIDTMNGEHNIQSAKAYTSGTKKLYRYVFNNGKSIKATKEHRIKIVDPNNPSMFIWKKAGNLVHTDVVSTVNGRHVNHGSSYFPIQCAVTYTGSNVRHNWTCNNSLTEDLGLMLGFFTGDGHYGDAGNGRATFNVCFSHLEEDNRDKVKSILSSIFKTVGSDSRVDHRKYPLHSLSMTNKAIKAFMDKVGVNFGNAHHKRIPTSIWSSPKSVKQSYLRGLFTADGGFQGKSIVLTTVSKELAYEVGNLLGYLGIKCRVRNHKEVYKVAVMVNSMSKFINQIGVEGTYKNSKIPIQLSVNSSMGDLPTWFSSYHIKDVTTNPGAQKDKKEWTKYQILSQTRSGKKTLTKEKIEDLTETLFTYDPTTLNRVEEIGDEIVFDITVIKGEPEFVSNGIVVHNSADHTNLGLLNFYNRRQELALTNPLWKKVKVISQIYDAVYLLVPDSLVDEVMPHLLDTMENTFPNQAVKHMLESEPPAIRWSSIH